MCRASVWSDDTRAAGGVAERALRLVVVGPVPPPAGGMAGQTQQLVSLWCSEGVDATLLPVNPPYQLRWIGRIRGLRAMYRLPRYVSALWRAARQADCFHIMANSGWSWFLFALPALTVARVRRVPVVVNYRGGQAAAFLARFGMLVRPAMRLADALIVPSGFLQSVFEGHGLRPGVIPNAVDVERFRWREPSATIPEAPHVIVTRNLEPLYDIPTALRAFSHLRLGFPRARLTVAGDGPERGSLDRLAAELGLGESVRFTGRLDREQIIALYAEADVMLNTSIVDNMPNSLLEAFAAGVPVVTTAAGGIAWMVCDGKTALVVSEGDYTAAARAMERVLEDRALTRELACQGRQAALGYAWPVIRRQWADLYTQIGGKARKPCQ